MRIVSSALVLCFNYFNEIVSYRSGINKETKNYVSFFPKSSSVFPNSLVSFHVFFLLQRTELKHREQKYK